MRVGLTSLIPPSPTPGQVMTLTLTLAGVRVAVTLTMRLVTLGVGAGACAALSWSRPRCLSSSPSLSSFPPSTLFSGQSMSRVTPLLIIHMIVRPRTLHVINRKCIKWLRENNGGIPSEVSVRATKLINNQKSILFIQHYFICSSQFSMSRKCWTLFVNIQQ